MPPAGKRGATHLNYTEHDIDRRKFLAGLGVLLASCTSVQVTQPNGQGQGVQTPRDLNELAELDGQVIPRNHPDYALWHDSMPWQNWTAPRYPALIVRPKNTTGAQQAVRFASEHGLKLAVKSGGHNLSQAFLREDSLLLDMGEFQGVSINASDKTAWVEPALWSDGLMKALQAQRLAFPVAHCATVPMGGYLLGGGVGLNGDEWGGIACHSILAAEVITADGELLVCSPDQHPDLYWAVRGGGMEFCAVVTRFLLQLYELPSDIFESSYFFPFTNRASAIGLLEDIAAAKPRNTELMMLVAHNPMAPPDASLEEQKVCIARIIAYGHSKKESEQLLASAKNHPASESALMKNEMIATNFDQLAIGSVDVRLGMGFGRMGVDTVWTDQLATTLNACAEAFVSAPSPKSHLVVSPKMNRQLHNDAAFSVVGDTFVGAYAMWDEEQNDAVNFDWLKRCGQSMYKGSEGQYINEVNPFADANVPQRCFSPEAWRKLQSVRTKYDPDGVFYTFS